MASSGKRWRRLAGPLAVMTTFLVVFAGAGSASAATLVADDFEDGNASGWTTTGGTWIVNWDDSNRVLRQSSYAANALARRGTVAWQNYTVSAQVKPENFNGLPGWVGVVARASSTSNYYALVLKPDDTAALTRTVGGTTQTLATLRGVAVEAGAWYSLSLTVNGQRLTGSVGGASISVTDGFLGGGPAGLLTTWSSASFDSVVVSD